MNIRLTELEDYSPPRRSIWPAIVLVIVVAGVFMIVRSRSGKQDVVVSAVEPDGVAATEAPTPDRTDLLPVGGSEPSVSRSIPTEGTNEAGDMLRQGREAEGAGDLTAARRWYVRALTVARRGQDREEAESSVGRVSMELLMSPHPMPEKKQYTVAPGDSLQKIAARFGTSPYLVAKGNNVKNPNRIKAGDHLRVFSGKFDMVVRLKKNELILSMNGEFCKRYRVGTGAYDRTPKGAFVITEKLEKPTWYRRDGDPVPFGEKENILGTRWMTIKDVEDPNSDRRGLGIHGTWDESSIGKSLSAGCVRLLNTDVEELFILVPVGTAVVVTD